MQANDADLRQRLRQALLDRRVEAGHWEGRLSSSALATATAVTALSTAQQAGIAGAGAETLARAGVDWLVAHRNSDGGWGDTPASVSNISTTALVWAALAHGRGPEIEWAAREAEGWIARTAGSSEPPVLAATLARRYGKDRTFSIPILTMCAISGRLGPGPSAWRLIPRLPFELAALPQGLFRWLRLPVVSYALPALISMGLARHRRGPGAAPLRAARERIVPRVLRVLDRLQPRGGGFLEAVPLTSFVTMSLIAAGESHHPVVARGLEFIARSAREDGSWPIDTNLATWVTTLAVNSLAASGGLDGMTAAGREHVRDWLLGQQWRAEHPYTGAAPGGWAWTDLPGGVPDADDTAGALIALYHLDRGDSRVQAAAAAGVGWLLDLQNRDGGIPTFCRGWGALPFDRSGTDLTAHALRAWAAWQKGVDDRTQARIAGAARRAVAYLARTQRGDGAFVPLWFGNQGAPTEENPVFGTSRVLSGLRAARTIAGADADPLIARAERWLIDAQNADGGWGGAPGVPSSIEETGAAIMALSGPDARSGSTAAVARGRAWLAAATDGGWRFEASPIGLYFARLWYDEVLYPAIFAAGAQPPIANTCFSPRI